MFVYFLRPHALTLNCFFRELVRLKDGSLRRAILSFLMLTCTQAGYADVLILLGANFVPRNRANFM